MFMNKLNVMAAAVSGALLSSSAMALPIVTTQGTVGSTSTGYVAVEGVIPSLVKISGLTDIDLGTFDGTSNMTDSASGICVYSNTSGSTYQVAVKGVDSAGAYAGSLALDDGSGNSLAYTLTFAGQTLADGATSTSITGDSDPACGNSVTSVLDIAVAAATASGVPAATYNGAVELLVSPI
jgi:spore coat protein U-like protein